MEQFPFELIELTHSVNQGSPCWEGDCGFTPETMLDYSESPDTPESNYPVHKTLLGAGKYLVENVANAQSMPPIGGFTLALPIRLQGMTEAPFRLIGLIRARLKTYK